MLATAAAPAAHAAEHRYGVRTVVVDGTYVDGQFYDRATGRRFVPRGNTYLRRDWRDVGFPISHQATFDVGHYDAAAAEAALREMRSHGYNVVKVFLDAACTDRCLGDAATGGLSRPYLLNVVDFLRRAKAARIAVIIAGDEPPWGTTWNRAIGAKFDGFNIWYLTARGVDNFGAYWATFAKSLIELRAPLDAVFAYELGGETWFQPDRYPLSLTHGHFTAANGRTYDLARAGEKERMLAESLAHWTQRVRAAIRSVDRTALVTMGVIAPTLPHAWRPGDSRYSLPLPALEATALDFLDLHAYPGWDLPVQLYAENFGFSWPSQKPLLLGEYGAYRFRYPTPSEAVDGMTSLQRETCGLGFDGWLLWTWDTPTPVWPQMWSGISEGGLLAGALGPRLRPNPCA